MRIIKSILFLLFLFVYSYSLAQEQFGKTLNIGIGVGGYSGYYGYASRSLPAISANYEFDVVPNFTLAPFIMVTSFSRDYYWGNAGNPYRNYTYRETVIPIGVKGTYYFDDLINATDVWDLYIAGSLGFAFVTKSWDSGYTGNRNYYRSGNPVFLDIHIGAEYHFNTRLGVFLDVSSSVSTIGLAIHSNK